METEYYAVLTRHTPVLLNEVIESLNLNAGDNVVDGTVGGGGHTEAILERIGPEGRLLGIDIDGEALQRVKERLSRFGKRVILVQDNFRHLTTILRHHFPYPVHAILLDLGISSDQLADPRRGFSFLSPGPLDMRLGGRGDAPTRPASAVVNDLPEAELARIIRVWGEERYAKAIAHSINVSRAHGRIETTDQLASCVLRALPPHARREGNRRIHPATRTFQALRIYVNGELEALKETLPQTIDAVERGGRIAIISFHSLEDRIVKQQFAAFAREGIIKVITKRPQKADAREVVINPRARSAKLRVAERIKEK